MARAPSLLSVSTRQRILSVLLVVLQLLLLLVSQTTFVAIAEASKVSCLLMPQNPSLFAEKATVDMYSTFPKPATRNRVGRGSADISVAGAGAFIYLFFLKPANCVTSRNKVPPDATKCEVLIAEGLDLTLSLSPALRYRPDSTA